MFCKYCGKEIKDDAQFCPYCGKEQETDATEETKSDKKGDSKEQADSVNTVEAEKGQKAQKSSTGGKGTSLRKVIPIVTAAVVIIVVIGIVGITRSASGGSSSGSSSGLLGIFSGKSSEYKTAYNFASENALKIVLREYQEYLFEKEDYEKYEEDREKYQDEKGSYILPAARDNDTFEAYVNEYDPQLFETYMDQNLSESGFCFTDYFMDDGGTDVYIKDYDVVSELRNSGENVYKLCATEVFSNDVLNKDARDYTSSSYYLSDQFNTIAVNDNYALLCSKSSIDDILRIMSNKSGYVAVTDVIRYLIKEIDEVTGAYADYVRNGGTHAGEDDVDWDNYEYEYENADAAEGRRDALVEYYNKWEDARIEWETEFLEDYDLEDEVANIEDNHIDTTDESTSDSSEDYDEYEDEYYDTEEETDSDEVEFQEEKPSRDSNIWELIDKDGNKCSYYLDRNFRDSYTAEVADDGKWQIYSGYGYMIASYDKDGNRLYEPGQLLYYPHQETLGVHTFSDGEVTGITPSNNKLLCTAANDLEHGDYLILSWLKEDGTTQELVKMYDYLHSNTAQALSETDLDFYGYNTSYYPLSPSGFVYSDKWQVNYRTLDESGTAGSSDSVYDFSGENPGSTFTSFVIDLATGEMSEPEPEEDTGEEITFTDPFADVEIEQVEEDVIPDKYVEISPDYYLNTDTWDVYSKDDLDTRVTQLPTGGGVAQMLYVNDEDMYWVITDTDYYYKMDGDFNQVADPVHINGSSFVSPYGVFVNDDDGGHLYNELGEEIISSDSGFSSSGFVTFDSEDAYNLNTNELLRVTKPAENEKEDN